MKEPAKIDNGLVVKPMQITPLLYSQYFTDLEIGEFHFKAIHPLFARLLEEENSSIGTVVLRNEINTWEYPSTITKFLPKEKDLTLLCLSPKKIMWYFLQYQEKLAGNNFFLLENTPTDLRIVDIKFLKEVENVKKYFLNLFLFPQHWEILGRNLNGKSLDFVTDFVI